MATRRHLRVIATSTTGDVTEARPPGRWILLGGLLALILWLPLGMAGMWLSRLGNTLVEHWSILRGMPASLLVATTILVPILGSFAVSAFVSGIIVVRFGSVTRLSQAGLVGALAGFLVTTLAAAAGVLRPFVLGASAYIGLVSVGFMAAAWGGRWGRRLRNAANLRAPT